MELKYCKVKFDGYSSEYDFLNLAQEELTVGDKVLLKCSSGIQKGVITEVNTNKDKSNNKAYVFQKIDNSFAEKIIAQIKEKEKLMKQMEQREKQLTKLNYIKLIADRDSKMKELYDKYNEIDINF